MWKNLLFLIGMTGFLALSSCTSENKYSPPVFPKHKELRSIRLSSDGLLVNYPYDICVDNKYIYILSLVDNTWIQVYDKTDEKYIGGYIVNGQGPGEIIMGNSLSYDEENNIITVFDSATRKLLSYKTGGSGDELLSFVDEKEFNEQTGEVIRQAWKLSGDKYLVDGQMGENTNELKRFQLLESNKIVAEYNQFPSDSPEEQLIYIMNASISISPDHQKMAVGTLFGGILEVFDLSGNLINKIATRRFYPPIVHYEPGMVKNTSGTIFGFSHLHATDDYIYSVLIAGKDPNVFDNIAVFDWIGNEIINYHTDCLVFKLFVSANEPDKLYAIAFSNDEGFYLVYFQLN